jgi:hypothetical protein
MLLYRWVRSDIYNQAIADKQISAIAHRVQEDDIHDGFYIPKGSLVIPNIWSVLQYI